MSKLGENPVKTIDIMIAGAEKAGTSSLAKYIEVHDNITSHKALEFTYFVNDDEYQRGYESAFSSYFECRDAASKILLAKNVGVMYWRKAIERAYQHNPDMRIVCILRNPIERAYSAFWYARRLDREPIAEFETAIALEPERLRVGGDLARYCAYVDRGMYYRQIEQILNFFPRSNVFIYLFEDIKNDPVAVCNQIYSSLGLDKPNFISVSETHNAAAMPRSKLVLQLLNNALIKKTLKSVVDTRKLRVLREKLIAFNERKIEVPKMSKEMRRQLAETFAEPNRLLGHLIGRDLSAWK